MFARPTARDRQLPRSMRDRLGSLSCERPLPMDPQAASGKLVMLEREWAQEQQFIVPDEPTANLDFRQQGPRSWRNQRDCRLGLGVLFTTTIPPCAARPPTAYLIRGGDASTRVRCNRFVTRGGWKRCKGRRCTRSPMRRHRVISG